MRETMTFALAVLLAVPLLGGDAAVDELVVQAKDHVHDHRLAPPDSIAGVIESALADAENVRQLVAVVRERFGLTEQTARLITIASLHTLVVDGAVSHDDVIRMLDDDYRAALRSDPSKGAIAREYLALLGDTDNQFPDAAKRIGEVLRGLRREQRGAVALQVMSDSRVSHADPALFEAVTQSYGFDPLALAIAGDELFSSNAAEIFDRATTLWLAQHDVDSAAAAAARAIYAYGQRDSVADVLRVYRSLPQAAKAIVLRAPAVEATVRSRGAEWKIQTRDVRFTLAAAFILAGDSRAALPLLSAAQPSKDDAAIAAMLRAAIDAPGVDAFDLVTGYLQNVTDKSTVLVDEAFDRVATRAGYATASKWRLEVATGNDERLAKKELTMMPPSVAALVPLRFVSGSGVEPISAAAARLLNTAPLASVVERPVDDGDRSSDRELAIPPSAPAFDVLRTETRGDEIVAVAVSQAIDPTGPNSAGGYWILRSIDRGATWRPPLYTGVRVLQPYEVVIGSTLPMLRDDGLRIEVTAVDADDAVGVPQAREGIAIDLKWRDLERDSDGDGLTDLMEARILTDPNSADTDGDGIPDATDPLPRTAFRQSAGEAPAIIATAIEALYGAGIEQPASRQELSPRTIFVQGDPEVFAGVRSRLRILVLSEAEVDAASKKFGPTLPTLVSPLIVDQTGRRAWVELNDVWSGVIYLLHKNDRNWTAESVASWVNPIP
jgi:hypothetical protein